MAAKRLADRLAKLETSSIGAPRFFLRVDDAGNPLPEQGPIGAFYVVMPEPLTAEEWIQAYAPERANA